MIRARKNPTACNTSTKKPPNCYYASLFNLQKARKS
nr:MAG TPA: hypothetical protein [Caudoviricetes sp.]